MEKGGKRCKKNQRMRAAPEKSYLSPVCLSMLWFIKHSSPSFKIFWPLNFLSGNLKSRPPQRCQLVVCATLISPVSVNGSVTSTFQLQVSFSDALRVENLSDGWMDARVVLEYHSRDILLQQFKSIIQYEFPPITPAIHYR